MDIDKSYQFDPIEKCLSECVVGLDAHTVWIAFSGGIDSTVLLHAAKSIFDNTHCLLKAVHINHQLQADADVWANHCQSICDQLDIPLDIIQVETQAFSDLGVEGAAREARYQAFTKLLKANEVLMTAHHADDQVETVLFQLIRGTGPQGLAGCAAQRDLGEAKLYRPLLNITRSQIEHYAKTHQLTWIDDPSNQSLQHDRNFIRHEIMPALKQRWPSLAETITRSAQWQSESVQLLDDLAALDLADVNLDVQTLPIAKLRHMSVARQKNVLRWWIRQQGFATPSMEILNHILKDVVACPVDREPCVTWQNCELRKYRNELYLLPTLPEHDPAKIYTWNVNEALTIPGIKITLTKQALENFGIDLNTTETLQVRFRQGGERIRPRGRGCEKDLKTLFQETGVMPWLRDRIPLLYQNDKLICVWGFWLAE